jgi:hypothetical protein
MRMGETIAVGALILAASVMLSGCVSTQDGGTNITANITWYVEIDASSFAGAYVEPLEEPVMAPGLVEIGYAGPPGTSITLTRLRVLHLNETITEINWSVTLTGSGDAYREYMDARNKHLPLKDRGGLSDEEKRVFEETYYKMLELAPIVEKSRYREVVRVDLSKVFKTNSTPGHKENVTFVVEFEHEGRGSTIAKEYTMEVAPKRVGPPPPSRHFNLSNVSFTEA